MSVAQLDRVTASDAVGSGFDSRRAHQKGSRRLLSAAPLFRCARRRNERRAPKRLARVKKEGSRVVRARAHAPDPPPRSPPCGKRRIPGGHTGGYSEVSGCRFARAKRRSADSSPARRQGRQRAMLAALPVAPAAPLPKNLASLRFSGALIFELRSRTGLACCVSVTDAFAVFGTSFAFCARSLRSLRSVGMTGGGV